MVSTLQFNCHGRVLHQCDYDFTRLRSDFIKPSVLLHLLLLWYIDETYNQIAHKGYSKCDHCHLSLPPSNIAPSTIVLPLTNPILPMLVMLVRLVMSLLLQLQLLQEPGWLLLAMAIPPIGRQAKNRVLASVAATKRLRQWKELSGCLISSSGTWSMKFLSMLPRL